MSILKGLLKVGLSPLRGVKEIIDDVSGDNDKGSQAGSILTFGATSVVKGTAKGLKDGIEEIFN